MKTTSRIFYLEAVRGNIVDTQAIQQFGYADDIDPADGECFIWDGMADDIGGKVTDITLALTDETLYASSDSTSDTAVVLAVEGHTEAGLHITQTVTLNGQTSVALTTDMYRVYRVLNVNGTNLVGNVFLHTGGATTGGRPDDTTTIRAIVRGADNVSRSAGIHVPDGHEFYITNAYASISNAITAECEIRAYAKRDGGVWFNTYNVALQTSGTSVDNKVFTTPLRLLSGQDLVFKATAFTNNISVSLTVVGLMVNV